MLLPITCPVCGAAGGAPCAGCAGGLVRLGRLVPPEGVDACAAVLAYDPSAARLVGALKYRNGRRLLPWLGAELAGLARQTFAAPPDAVTWVPTLGQRRRARGFDHAELLARAVARRLGLPCRRLLERRSLGTQTGHGREDRLRRPRFEALRCTGAVLLVDDVLTTGATVRAAAHALRWGGASEVLVLVAAHRPWSDNRVKADGGLTSPEWRSPSAAAAWPSATGWTP